MNVFYKGNKGVVSYRGVAFVQEQPTEVDPAWFEGVKSPNIIEHKPKPKKVKKAE